MRAISCVTLSVKALLFSLFLPWLFPQARADISIGVILPLSGFASLVGESQKAGVQLGIDEINARPGRLGPLTAIFKDDQSSVDVANRQATELIIREQIRFIIGAPLAHSALAVARQTNSAKVLFIATGSVSAGADAKVGTLPFWFHVGTDLDRLTEIKARVEKNTSLKASTQACPSPPSSNYDFSVCARAFVDNGLWRDFRGKIAAKTRNESLANLSAASAYVAIKILYEAIHSYGTDPGAVADALRQKKFETLFGTKTFGKEQKILTTPLLSANPTGKSTAGLTEILSRLKAEAKDKCDDCKKSGECPQGATALVSEDECCKSNEECPQGLVIFRR